MTASRTRTQTNSYSWTDTRYVNDKIGADIHYIRTRYPGIYSEDQANTWHQDFYQWIQGGFAKSTALQFLVDGTCIFEVRWEINSDGTITGDDQPGLLTLPSLRGARATVLVHTTAAWDELSEDGKQRFYNQLSRGWGPAKPSKYADGMHAQGDKQYSKNNLGVQRTVKRSVP